MVREPLLWLSYLAAIKQREGEQYYVVVHLDRIALGDYLTEGRKYEK